MLPQTEAQSGAAQPPSSRANHAKRWLVIGALAAALVGIIDLIGGAGAAKKLLGDSITGRADVLKTLGITKEGLYATFGVNDAPTTEPKTNVINGIGTNGGMTVINNITTRDDPNAIADATARELRLSQAGMYAP